MSAVAPNPTLVVPGTPVTQTVTTAGITTVTLFNGYAPVYSTGQTVLSPYGAFYGSPAYIGAGYVIDTPYPYASSREIAALSGITIVGGTNTVYVQNAPQIAPQTPSGANNSDGAGDANDPNAITGQKADRLRDALADMQAFWVRDDVRALRRHLSANGTIAVFQNEKFAYSLKRADFLSVSTDTLNRVQTQGLDFRRVTVRSDGMVNAYAAHTYRVVESVNQTPQKATMRVTLAWDGNNWLLSAISLSPGSRK